MSPMSYSIIKCDTCHDVLDSREVQPWTVKYCSCETHGIYVGYDQGDIYYRHINGTGTDEGDED